MYKNYILIILVIILLFLLFILLNKFYINKETFKSFPINIPTQFNYSIYSNATYISSNPFTIISSGIPTNGINSNGYDMPILMSDNVTYMIRFRIGSFNAVPNKNIIIKQIFLVGSGGPGGLVGSGGNTLVYKDNKLYTLSPSDNSLDYYSNGKGGQVTIYDISFTSTTSHKFEINVVGPWQYKNPNPGNNYVKAYNINAPFLTLVAKPATTISKTNLNDGTNATQNKYTKLYYGGPGGSDPFGPPLINLGAGGGAAAQNNYALNIIDKAKCYWGSSNGSGVYSLNSNDGGIGGVWCSTMPNDSYSNGQNSQGGGGGGAIHGLSNSGGINGGNGGSGGVGGGLGGNGYGTAKDELNLGIGGDGYYGIGGGGGGGYYGGGGGTGTCYAGCNDTSISSKIQPGGGGAGCVMIFFTL
jgi:hypothetical protein